MDKFKEYKRYTKKCEMLNTKMFKFELVGEDIVIVGYIENDELERLVRIPDFVNKADCGFIDVKQRLKISGGKLNSIKFFEYCGDKLDLRGLNTELIRDMSYMFSNCRDITEIHINDFNTSNVTSMEGMFNQCYKLRELDLSSFDTSKVYNMQNMFNGCGNIEKVNVSSFNTSNVENMRQMFCGCNIRELDLSNFDTSRVKDISFMFYNCINLEVLDISKFTTSIKSKWCTFDNCRRLRLVITNKEFKAWLEKYRGETKLSKKCEIRVKGQEE